ncbi:MAG: UDP-N-acetylglucosamine 2-epimerase (hydrolyzing) [Candidatus Omnitrophica bacterium]|nr:UDP-N-acetylglucosamine 2-epimerase (hydrolyzing) [Candidatus Omnitrophota bacterium]
MRTIGVVTVNRSDYGISLPILRRIQQEPELALHLIVAGAHLSPEFGLTVTAIEADGFHIGDRVEMLVSSDTPEGIVKSMGLGLIGFAQSFTRRRPDMVVVVADRFEMHAAALAALPLKIPLAHVHGGELSQGAMDDALRHSITKLSHLHFVSTKEAAHRVRQMGEEAWRVVVSGAPSLDHVRTIPRLSIQELEARVGMRLGQAPLLVTYHPVTLEYEQTEWQIGELLAALQAITRPMVFTLPNPDTSSRVIRRMIEAFLERQPHARLVENFGTQGYLSIMGYAAAMVGNSSSGIIEAPSFELPVVNIGTRQEGRVRADNVIDVNCARADIAQGIVRALAPTFRARLRGLHNPYGQGDAAEIIVGRLKDIPLDARLIRKRFIDQPGQADAADPQASLYAR